MENSNNDSFTDALSDKDLTSLFSTYNDREDIVVFEFQPSFYYDIDSLISQLETSANHFTVLSLNIQSIKAKWSLFGATLDCLFQQNVSPCVILLQETWLDFQSNLYDISNYDTFFSEEDLFTTRGFDYLYQKRLFI